jgi:predicted phosphodiesterase
VGNTVYIPDEEKTRMKLAIMSDIHANLQALNAVLKDQRENLVNSVICLGDTIGYGGQPDHTIKKLIEYDIPSVLGNHELAVKDSSYLAWFNPVVRKSAAITRALLSQESLNFIFRLKSHIESENYWFVHGFPPDSVTTYIYEVADDRIEHVIQKLNKKIIFIGHTHEPALIRWDGHQLHHLPLKKGVQSINPAYRYIINVGSVGQPRDSDHHAKYVILDSNHLTIELRYISYDISAAAQKIISAGLPRQYAERLG